MHFDPCVISRRDLDAFAQVEGFGPIRSSGFELDREPQFYLRKNAARDPPLTPTQRTRLDLAVPANVMADDVPQIAREMCASDTRAPVIAS